MAPASPPSSAAATEVRFGVVRVRIDPEVGEQETEVRQLLANTVLPYDATRYAQYAQIRGDGRTDAAAIAAHFALNAAHFLFFSYPRLA